MSQTDSYSDDVPATVDNQYSFDETETRPTEMQDSLEQWVEDLASMTDDARASEESLQCRPDRVDRYEFASYVSRLAIKRRGVWLGEFIP